MGTLTARDIFERAAEVLNDVSYVTYLEAQLVEWVNDGQRAICLTRPDAKTRIESLALTANAGRHSLPAGARRLGGLIVNLGADGSTVGRAITGPVPREEMDGVAPTWRTETGSYVRQYVYDEDTPGEFWTYPVIASTWYVEAKLFRNPTDLASATDTIDLDDVYAPALREWILYCTFARDHERSPNYTRAARHFTNFFELLGVKTRADLAYSPKVLEHGKQLEATR